MTGDCHVRFCESRGVKLPPATHLTAGPVPARVTAEVKASLLQLIDHAVEHGWTRRQAAARLGVDDARADRWSARRAGGDLTDRAPGGAPVHKLLEWERAAIITMFEGWGERDRSHRKLAHRGSRLGFVHVSESTVLRVLTEERLVLPGNPARDPVPRKPWPDWLIWKPNHIWAYDFSHFTRARRAAVAVLDMVSRKWLTSVVTAEESSTQVEVAFTHALRLEGLLEIADGHGSAELRAALAAGDADALEWLTTSGELPLLLAVSDNGPQMRSYSTREFMAGVAIAQQFGRPHTPTDQAWIETLFGHVKGEWPHLEQISDPGELELELERVRIDYNTVRLHASIGYVTPDDEHEGRGDAIRQQRRDGLQQARINRIQYRRNQLTDTP
jgi:putative transposase